MAGNDTARACTSTRAQAQRACLGGAWCGNPCWQSAVISGWQSAVISAVTSRALAWIRLMLPLVYACAAAATLQVLLQGLPGGALEVAQGAVQGTEEASSSSSSAALDIVRMQQWCFAVQGVERAWQQQRHSSGSDPGCICGPVRVSCACNACLARHLVVRC
jgi:hypothetical protein